MSDYRQNPWWSPPALQYVARFTGNPPGNNGRAPFPNPWFSPPAMQYGAPFTGNPGSLHGYSHWEDLKDDVFATLPDSAEGVASSLDVPLDVVLKALKEEPAAVEHEGEWWPDEMLPLSPSSNPRAPAMQQMARFTVNPRGPEPMPFTEWKEPYSRGYGELDYLEGYSGPPGFDKRANPPARILAVAGRYPERVPEWRFRQMKQAVQDGELDDAINMLVGSWGLSPLPGDVQEILDDHEAAYEDNPSFHPGGGVWHGGRFRPGGGRAHHGGYHPGGGRRRHGKYYPGGGHFETNPEERHDVLCQCGWGRLGMPESEIPSHCPVCSHSIGVCDACGELKSECECGGLGHGAHGYGSGRHPLLDHYRQQGLRDAEDPDYDSRLYDDNPKYFSMKGRGIAKPYSRGVLRRGMETDPMHESRMKGMLAFYGKKLFGLELTNRQIDSMLGKGRKELGGRTANARYSVKKGKIRVGRREISVGPIRKGQKVKLGDVKSRVDAVFYSQSRGMSTLEGVPIGEETIPEPARGRLPAPKTKMPRRKPRLKTKKRKRANPPLPSSRRCTSKKNSGAQCKGRRLPGQKVCVFHSSKSQMKKRKKRA